MCDSALFLRNVGNQSPKATAQHLRRPESPSAELQEHKTSRTYKLRYCRPYPRSQQQQSSGRPVTVTHTEIRDQIDVRIRKNRMHITNKTSEISGERKAYGPDEGLSGCNEERRGNNDDMH